MAPRSQASVVLMAGLIAVPGVGVPHPAATATAAGRARTDHQRQ